MRQQALGMNKKCPAMAEQQYLHSGVASHQEQQSFFEDVGRCERSGPLTWHENEIDPFQPQLFPTRNRH
jgi:hypothetical protein